MKTNLITMYNHPRGKRCDVSKQERRSGETSIKRISRSKKIFCTGQLIRLKSKQRFLKNTQCLIRVHKLKLKRTKNKAQRSEADEESEDRKLLSFGECVHASTTASRENSVSSDTSKIGDCSKLLLLLLQVLAVLPVSQKHVFSFVAGQKTLPLTSTSSRMLIS
jgi:hypothetical protein